MPRGDGTGPLGMGPMSGRAAGFCAGFGMPGFENARFGRFRGAGYGRGGGAGYGFGAGGRGWRHRNFFRATGLTGRMRAEAAIASVPHPDPSWELQTLKARADALQSEMDWIRARMEALEAKAPEAKSSEV